MTYSKLPLLIAYLSAHVPAEKIANRASLGRQPNKTMPKRKKKRANTLPPFQRKHYPEGIYHGILKEKGLA